MLGSRAALVTRLRGSH